jgi:hypothetical protein
MSRKPYNPLSDRAIWIWIVVVFVCVLGALISIYIHEKAKPDSPHALVAAAFNQMRMTQEWQPGMGPKPLVYHPAAFTFGAKEWQPGMGSQPLIYHPAAANSLAWRPLPPRRQLAGR